jgi:hypothetical protein
MRRQRLARMSTGVLLIALSAGCSSGSKPNPAPASSGSPTVAAPQTTTPPTTQRTGASGPVVTLTSKEGYVYKLQAEPYTGPAITALDFGLGGGTGNAPPGKVFAAVAVVVSDGLPDRAEPLDPQFGSQPDLRLSVPADSAAAFGMAAKDCQHYYQPSSAWCDLPAQPSQGTGQPGHFGPFASTSQLEPGQPVSFMLATIIPIPQAAPIRKLTLFAQLGIDGNLVQVPVSPSG